MAHALYGYDGPCKNIHGHTYHLHVTLMGKPVLDNKNPKNGMVLDFKDLKKTVKELIIDIYDHALVLNADSPHLLLGETLNDEFEKIVFMKNQPTCENLLLHFMQLLKPLSNDGVKVVYLKLEETPDSYAEWFLSDNSQN